MGDSWVIPSVTSLTERSVYVMYSTTHQRSVEVQFGRYQKIFWFLVLSFSFWFQFIQQIEHTLRSVNDVTEGITQESPMDAS